jgi:hypothetical protein
VRKRQLELTLNGGNGKRKGTDTARLLFEVITGQDDEDAEEDGPEDVALAVEPPMFAMLIFPLSRDPKVV